MIIEERSYAGSRQLQTKRYLKGAFLGKGGFAKVYEIRNLEMEKVQAVKVVPKSTLAKSRAKQKLQSEIRIHRSMHHANIVSFENFFEERRPFFVEGVDIFEYGGTRTNNVSYRPTFFYSRRIGRSPVRGVRPNDAIAYVDSPTQTTIASAAKLIIIMLSTLFARVMPP